MILAYQIVSIRSSSTLVAIEEEVSLFNRSGSIQINVDVGFFGRGGLQSGKESRGNKEQE